MAWVVEIRETAERQIVRLGSVDKMRIMRFLRERIHGTDDPRSLGHSLKGELAGLWRYRVGDCRILCHLRDEVVTVVVLEIGHRREVYR
ncbi:type II toxin-antitoxin system RelE family toxin [Candidatus Magnetaquicoccus inordinatus]|uniref:type II toxin-antitoxin system RelE family toxin n=1 Tax=Candidatus Magnetaquicoccus inordinatus TaxID=2496818 RepID=UPI00102D08FE|nr:type II toxin-antitoxin system RelE/ParE family toxin [Candidatus Magnetaquicoccus inordinatus]